MENKEFQLSSSDQEALALAEKYGMEAVFDLMDKPLVQNHECRVSYMFVKQNGLLPVDQDEQGYLVAVCNPLNISALEELRLLLRAPVRSVFCPKIYLDQAIEHCYHQKQEQASSNEEPKLDTQVKTQEGYDLLEQTSDNPVVRILNTVLMEAIQQGSSDIHFEPRENDLVIRYRIDGILQSRHRLAKDQQSQMLTRVKVLAQLDIAEHRLPQDGRIKLRMGSREIDFRVSTIPIVYGERIVLRILDKGKIQLGLDHLGMSKSQMDIFRKWCKLPEGIVLVTGPTGSGKTTTLYSSLMEVNSSAMNIMTIEDPVEYKLPSIAQIAVNPKIELDFARGLRHILRQDPDVIMIGEIRDLETAEIAIQASLTGHLVFSTLHTNDAPSALTRLSDMGIEPYLLSSAVVGVLAQRLVRKICPSCKQSHQPTKEEKSQLHLTSDTIYRGKGCEKCFQTGYKGRHGIYELMKVTSEIKTQIIQSADAEALRRVCQSQKMQTLRSQGLRLVKEGITTPEEILRVISYHDMEG